jgi:hypothetical protein
MADGEAVADPDWESKEVHYRVRLDNKWVDVPDEAVITETQSRRPDDGLADTIWRTDFNQVLHAG